MQQGPITQTLQAPAITRMLAYWIGPRLSPDGQCQDVGGSNPQPGAVVLVVLQTSLSLGFIMGDITGKKPDQQTNNG